MLLQCSVLCRPSNHILSEMKVSAGPRCNTLYHVQGTIAKAAEEPDQEPEGEPTAQAVPAQLPDQAYIRTQATGDARQLSTHPQLRCFSTPSCARQCFPFKRIRSIHAARRADGSTLPL